MSDYRLTVGLEIHAELNTETKMFCNSKNDTKESRPNVNVCPICLGYPGTLPVINEEAVRKILRLGTALGGELADFTEFDRKNYFYPDIPKGYQISQYKHPLIKGGKLIDVRITRIHLEEDTAKSIHAESGESLLDFNRAGTPLLELVTEPVIHDKETAVKFAKEFQLLISPTYLNISSADMERGEMRVEANISISKDKTLGTKVEVKNLNSFKAVEKAIDFEIKRQTEILEKGGKVTQETRGWNEVKEETFLQRLKEEAHDYRYFPEPDLPKLFIKDTTEFSNKSLKTSLPELPNEKRARYKKDFKLKESDIEIYIREPEWGRLLEEVAETLKDVELIKLSSNYITSDLKKLVPAKSLVEVIRMVSRGEISSRGAKDILKVVEDKGGDPKLVAKENNLIQKSDANELRAVAEKIIKENPEVVLEYKKGKVASLQFLIGQAMKVTRGSGNPQVLKEIFTKII
ncbi:MAG: Asp-tRNA(Asn)/Glu-tRNA(Gln) amidotransferase subunit GatB [Patescibacteria group bacterium]|mgnify:CR=1 FL=1